MRGMSLLTELQTGIEGLAHTAFVVGVLALVIGAALLVGYWFVNRV